MATVEYCLFRVKIIYPSQMSLLHYKVTRSDIFVAALKEKPDSQVRRGYTWHIGNVDVFSGDSGYFAVGRTTRSTVEKFDFETGNFREEELETSPYTHCVFDAAIGLLGIAKKPSLAPTAESIARRIEDLLSATREVKENDLAIEIDPIPDPDSFLRELKDAYAVLRFSATFHRPNPFDADEMFQKPLGVYLKATGGDRGRTQVSGDDLDREVLTSVTKSTAATGNEAAAKIKRKKGARAVNIHLRGSALGSSYDEETHDPRVALEDLQTLYRHVRE